MNKDSQSNDIDLDTVSMLVPKAKNGSDSARDQLLEHVQGYIALMARKNNVDHLQAKFGNSDIVQQSLAQVIQGFDGFRGSSAKEFYGWLNQIVANEAKRLQRQYHAGKRDVARERQMEIGHSGSRIGYVPTDDGLTPKSKALAAEELRQFDEALVRLPEEYQQVVRLRSLERLPFKDVAAKMDRSVDSVRKIWGRAVLKLQQEIESNEATDES